jgi:Glycosyl transferases group 1
MLNLLPSTNDAEKTSTHQQFSNKISKTIRIIGFNNQKGLTKDIEILQQELSDLGAHLDFLEIQEKISCSTTQKMYHFAKAIVQHQIPYPRKHSISIFLERIVPELLGESQINLLIPNPEWFHPAWRFLSGQIDMVLCKTHHAMDLYRTLGFKTQYLGFTSPDKFSGHHDSKRPTFLHIAGGSYFKGTVQLVKTWEKHPEWPMLTVVTHRMMANYVSPAPNITLVTEFMDEAELTALQNNTLFHLYPSQAEGFGHCINEAMSCGAIVLTNNAAPMNELVTATEGFLFDCQVKGRNCLSDLVDFDEAAFTHQINTAIGTPPDQQHLRCTSARQAYQARDDNFRANLRSTLLNYLR